jgi:hypothetical protein
LGTPTAGALVPSGGASGIGREALALARTIGDIQQAALGNPPAVYPMDVDMSVLYLLGEFCANGRFEITSLNMRPTAPNHPLLRTLLGPRVLQQALVEA